MEKKLSCVMCGSDALRLDETARRVDIEGVATEVPFRMHWCEECGGEMALSEDLRFNARAMRQAHKKHYGLLTGEEVRKIRKQLGLNQEQAARLLGGGPVAFSKYENDEITQSESMDRLVWLVGTYPELVPVLAERVKIDLPRDGTIEIERYEFNYAEAASLVLTHAGANVTFHLLQGFTEISPASNDQIYQPGPRSRPTNWKVA